MPKHQKQSTPKSDSFKCCILRSGGRDLRSSAAYPKDFGRFIAREHLALMDAWLYKVPWRSLETIFREEKCQKSEPFAKGSDFDRFLAQHSPYMAQHSPQNGVFLPENGFQRPPWNLILGCTTDTACACNL